MKLKTGWQEEIINPTAEELEEVLLSDSAGGDSFVILEKRPDHYLQVVLDVDGGSLLEYRAGNKENHYRCKSDFIETPLLVNIFKAYNRGEIGWRDLVKWNHVEIGKRPMDYYWPFSKSGKAISNSIFSGLVVVILIFLALNSTIFGSEAEVKAGNLGAIAGVLVLTAIIVAGVFYFSNKKEQREKEITKLLKESGQESDALIVDVKYRVQRSEDFPTTYHWYIIFDYMTLKGVLRKKYEVTQGYLNNVSIGDSIKVVFDPLNPKVVRLKAKRRSRPTAWMGWKPPEKEDQKAVWRKRLTMGFVIGIILTIISSVFRAIYVASTGETSFESAFIGSLPCVCFPSTLVIWTAVGMVGAWILEVTLRQERWFRNIRLAPDKLLQFEPAVDHRLVACLHCSRHLIPGTGVCPYCQRRVNFAPFRLILAGLLLPLQLTMLLVMNKPSESFFTLILVTITTAIILFLGLREWLFWRNIK